MIRIRDIALPPEHDPNQLVYESSKLLKISASKIRRVNLVRRSVDARKKPDVKIIYTVDVTVDGNEQKILKNSGCKRAAIAVPQFYKVPKVANMPQKRPVIVGFGGRTDAVAEAPVLWPPDVKSRLIGKDPDDGKD